MDVAILDVVVLSVVAVTAIGGFRRGLVAGVLSLGGLVAGAVVGAKLAPGLVGGEEARFVPLVTLVGAAMGAALGQFVGVLLGRAARGAIVIGPIRPLDSAGGGVLGAATGLALCWALGAVLLYLPGQTDLRHYAQESVILSRLNDEFPPQRLIDALERIDPLAAIAGPEATVDPPDPALARAPQVKTASRSVVRVLGLACGLGLEGSGWIAAPGIVVTNAHVVAGVDRPRVDRSDGDFHLATVVFFDVQNDVAVLRVPGLRGKPLRMTEPGRGTAGALLGFPENGPLTAAPVRIGRTLGLFAQDAYGRYPVSRRVTLVRGSIRSGNSGGPVVDAGGRVLTTAFAERSEGGGGYGVPNESVREALARPRRPLATDCVAR
jgi:S1-C subfamily serine protease